MQGLEELRMVIANQLNKDNKNSFTSDDIVIGPGTKELMLLTQIAFEGEVLLPAPSWVSYQPQAHIAKNKVHWIQTTSDSDWFPTVRQLENKIKRVVKTLNPLEHKVKQETDYEKCINLKIENIREFDKKRDIYKDLRLSS
jgi:aspartate aminotransferase